MTKWHKTIAVILSLTLLFGLVLSSCSSPSTSTTGTTAAPKTLTFAVNESLTAGSSIFMKPAMAGMDFAKKYINDNGGITVNGQQYFVDYDVEDNKTASDAAATAATDLVSKGYKFMIGSLPNFVTRAIASVTEPAGVLYFPLMITGSADEVDPAKNKLIFYPALTTLDCLKASVIYLHNNYPDVKTITYVAVDDGTISWIEPKIRQIATNYGFTIPQPFVSWGLDTIDFTPIAQKAMAQNTDAIMLGSGPGQPAILKALRAAGYNKLAFSGSGNDPATFLALAGADAATNFFGPGISEKVTDAPPLALKLRDYLATNTSSSAMTSFYLWTFDGMYVMAQAIEGAQSLDPQVVANYLTAMGGTDQTMDTAFGPAAWGGAEIYGINKILQAPIPMQTLQNGVLKDVGWISLK